MSHRARVIYELKNNKNCHYHFEIQHETYDDILLFVNEKIKWYNNIRNKLNCDICENNNIAFHHKKPENKFIDISSMVNDRYNFTINDMRKEISKCIPLCRNCHDLIHGIIQKGDNKMTSQYQKKPSFPVDKLGKMQSINIDFNNQPFTLPYKELELVVINSQLCWKYEDDEGEVILPICRKSTIDKLFEEKE